MGKSPKAPKQSGESKKLERLQTELLEQQLEDSKKPLEVPKPPKPLPQLAPPREQDDQAYAVAEAKRRAMRRTNAGRGTLLAGETGGWSGGKNLLG